MRFDGPQNTHILGFQPIEGFKFKSPKQLSGSNKEIVIPLRFNAPEAEKNKIKQAKEDAKITELYKIDQLKTQAKKLGFSDNIIALINSSSFKIDTRSKTLSIKNGDTEFVYGKNGMKQVTNSYKGISNDEIKAVMEFSGNGNSGTQIYYKKNDEGKYVKVAMDHLDEYGKVIKSEIYTGSNVKTYNSSATDIDNSLISKRQFQSE